MEMNGTVRYCESAYAAAEGVTARGGDGLAEFRTLDSARSSACSKHPIIVDTKNLLIRCGCAPWDFGTWA